jgi:hypothetical protein
MRASLYLIGFAAASIVGAGVIEIGCSSSSSTAPPGGPDAAADSGGEDGGEEAAVVPCTPLSDASVATTNFGSTTWACTQMKCATDLQACAADCACNNALLTALACTADAGAMATMAQTFACFTPALSVPSAPMDLSACLISASQSCAGFVIDGGTDGGDSGTAATDAGDAGASTDGGDASDQ